MANPEHSDQWITKARARLAAWRKGRPRSKVGAVRSLWPEIERAIQDGQTLKSLRDWLEAEGVSLQYSQLTLYIRRIRKKQAVAVPAASEPEPAKPAANTDPVGRDPLANLRSREGRRRTFEYNPEFKEEELL
jgi:hypothetical protein